MCQYTLNSLVEQLLLSDKFGIIESLTELIETLLVE